jgi:hypothetical protein
MGIFNSFIGGDKKNHKEASTWMLTQRIGPLNLENLKFDDGVERIYYDKLEELEDGRTYKGEW